ncbi:MULTISPECIES: benzoate/H(+) symporter BenE family transporter [Pseudomonas]|uniref:benzoate/H(+) symporter BenE family transporter n=1 Tax=Pseudomonas TaxID=286 RepID=UPI00123A3B17|nr:MULTISPECIES: benzoate/H(+) symporter BenE family transporter [Pseudomonas]QIB52214.1 benzoate/H(+) symporter BenE family transporter [Pseudomonas sp. OIL-1]
MNSTISTKASFQRVLADSSLSSITAGFVAMLTAYSSSLVLIIQAGQAAGLSDVRIASWVWAISIGMAVCTIGLSLRYRAPIVVAWSTPGAALLITSLPNVAFAEAIGAFLFCGVLLLVTGLTGSFERLIRRLPASLAAALLAGILFRITSEIFVAIEHQTLLVLGMFGSYLLGKRWSPRYAVLSALLTGSVLAYFNNLFSLPAVDWALTLPTLTAPQLSFTALLSIGLPLYIVAMASQNLPGMAVLRASGYEVKASPLLSATGLASLLLAPFGSHGINLAAISAALCTGPEAHPDPARRYTAALWCGLFYCLIGLFAGSLTTLFLALPGALVLSVAALALLGSIADGLSRAMAEPADREAALITFLISASGMTLFSVGSAFWGLVAGLVSLGVLRWKKPD